jgi:hypothetical protein
MFFLFFSLQRGNSGFQQEFAAVEKVTLRNSTNPEGEQYQSALSARPTTKNRYRNVLACK